MHQNWDGKEPLIHPSLRTRSKKRLSQMEEPGIEDISLQEYVQQWLFVPYLQIH